MKPYVKISLFVVLFIAMGGIFVALYFYNLKPKDLGNVRPDFILSAVDFQKAFDENEKAATLKYVNKIIEVTGEIASAKPGEKKVLNVILKTGSDFSTVICTFPSEKNISSLVPGKVVTIRGVCSGFLMDVLLNNCVLVENPKQVVLTSSPGKKQIFKSLSPGREPAPHQRGI